MHTLVFDQSAPPFGQMSPAMFQHRKKIFCDELGWVPAAADQERDEFDNDDAVYVINHLDGRIQSSVRLLPTTKPHLMSEYFAHLCADPVQRQADTLEVSRLFVAPDVPIGRPRAAATEYAIASAIEAGLALNAKRLTFVLALEMFPFMINAALPMVPLGIPQGGPNGDLLAAWQMTINPRVLDAYYRLTKRPRPTVSIQLQELEHVA